ncbi:hypothetical protein C5167_039645, partial [Papaver somniferum]
MMLVVMKGCMAFQSNIITSLGDNAIDRVIPRGSYEPKEENCKRNPRWVALALSKRAELFEFLVQHDLVSMVDLKENPGGLMVSSPNVRERPK